MLVIKLLLFLTQAYASTGLQPDPTLTPGDFDPSLTVEYLCSHSTKERRNVPDSLKQKVCADYKVTCSPGKQEIDHRISLVIGGTNSAKNLWPQPIADAKNKDVVEAYLGKSVCKGLPLERARKIILDEWMDCFVKLKQKMECT